MKMYLVLSPGGHEGFATQSEQDAMSVADGIRRGFGSSTVGEAFREAYADSFLDDRDADDNEEGGMETEFQIVEIEVPSP